MVGRLISFWHGLVSEAMISYMIESDAFRKNKNNLKALGSFFVPSEPWQKGVFHCEPWMWNTKINAAELVVERLRYWNRVGGWDTFPSRQDFHWSNISDPFKLITNMGVSKNGDTPKSSILIGFSIVNHPFWDTPIFGNTHIGYSWNRIIFRIFGGK